MSRASDEALRLFVALIRDPDLPDEIKAHARTEIRKRGQKELELQSANRVMRDKNQQMQLRKLGVNAIIRHLVGD